MSTCILSLQISWKKIIGEYKLGEIVTDDGHVYCEIKKGMYGLPQMVLIVQELLEQ
jgi:hypothetical protein